MRYAVRKRAGTPPPPRTRARRGSDAPRCAERRRAPRTSRRGARREPRIPPSCARPGLITTRSSGARENARAVGAEDVRQPVRWRGQPLPQPDVDVVECRGAKLDDHLALAGLGIGHVLVAENLGAADLVDADRLHAARSYAAQGFRLLRCNNGDDDHSRRAAAGSRARPRRGRRGAGRGLRRHRAAHPRAEGPRALRAARLHDLAPRGLVPSRVPPRRRRERRLGGALLLPARARAACRATAGCRATPGTTDTPSCARSSTRSAASSARPTACWSTRTSTSTARPPRAPASGSTARTRC